MSSKRPKNVVGQLRRNAPIFAALGDATRLLLLSKLGDGSLLSITRLTQESKLTRQAITKHLRVLQRAGLVRGVRRGRESLFEIEPTALAAARQSLDNIAKQWDLALSRLRALVED